MEITQSECPNGKGPTSPFGLSSSHLLLDSPTPLAAESGMEPQSPHHSQKYFHGHRGRGSATSIRLHSEAALLLTQVIPCLSPQEEAKHHTQPGEEQLTQELRASSQQSFTSRSSGFLVVLGDSLYPNYHSDLSDSLDTLRIFTSLRP